MVIGKMDRQIKVGVYSTTANSSGELVETWTYSGFVWANVSTSSGGEGFEANQLVGTETKEFIFRFQTIVQKDRILFGGVNYDVIKTEEIGRRNYIKVTAKKQDNG